MSSKAKHAIFSVSILCICVSVVNSATLIKGPYLIYEDDPTQMTILGQLDVSANVFIDWGLDESFSQGSHTSVEVGDHQHIYTITGLTPATKYFYRLTIDTEIATGSFRTAPPVNAANVKFLVYGDTRSYPENHDLVCNGMVNTYTVDPDYQSICLHVGDWVATGENEGDWATQFFDSARLNTHKFLSDIPINGCIGNHEGAGSLYKKYYPYPYVNTTDFYWSFDYGPVHVAVVDQYHWDTDQETWLETDLDNSNKEWKIIVLHEPGWALRHASNMVTQHIINYICPAYGVDLVFAGHDHHYARHYINGVYQITTGGGGAPLYDTSTWWPETQVAEITHQFCEIDIQSNVLTFKARRVYTPPVPPEVYDASSTVQDPIAPNGDGQILDTFTITHAPVTDYEVTPLDDASFSGPQGYLISDSTVYILKNNTTEAVDWTVTKNADWLILSAIEGNISAGTTFDVTLTVADTESLAPGIYSEEVTFSFNSGSEVYTRGVTLTIGDGTPPATPANLTAEVLDHQSIRVSADVVTDDLNDVQYKFRRIKDGVVEHGSDWLEEPVYTDIGLEPSTLYGYTVQARDTSEYLNESDESTSCAAMTLDLPPELPWADDFESGNLSTGDWNPTGNVAVTEKAANTGTYGVLLKGTASMTKQIDTARVTGVEISYERKTKGLDSNEWLTVEWIKCDVHGIPAETETWTNIEETTTNTYEVNGAVISAAGVEGPGPILLRFSINASNAAEYAYIDNVNISCQDSTLPGPTYITSATGTTNLQVLLEWTGPSDNDLAGYKVYQYDDVSTVTTDVGLVSNWTGNVPDNIAAYSYEVIAYDLSGNECPNDPANIVLIETWQLVPPSDLAAEAGSGTVTLTWTGYKTVKGYIVLTNDTESDIEPAIDGTIQYTINGLENGTYTFGVKAVSLDGTSESLPATITVTLSDVLSVSATNIVVSLMPDSRKYFGEAIVTVSSTPPEITVTVSGNWYFRGAVIATETVDVLVNGTYGTATFTSPTRPVKTGDFFTFEITDITGDGIEYVPDVTSANSEAVGG